MGETANKNILVYKLKITNICWKMLKKYINNFFFRNSKSLRVERVVIKSFVKFWN